MIHWAQPEWLWLLWMLPPLAWWLGRRGAVAAVEYSSTAVARQVAHLTRSRLGRLLPFLRLLVLALIIIGLARPQLGQHTNEIKASGVDLMLLIDVSGSMEALDFTLHGQPVNRLEVVKSVVAEFIKARPNDRIGLIAFAGAPYLVSPLTLDHDWLLQNLERMQIGLVEDGTAIGSALTTGLNRLREQKSKSKIMVLLTDGMNNAGTVSPKLAAEAAQAIGIKTYTVGAGTEGKAPTPIRDQFGRTQLVMVKVEVDEKTLQAIATETGGRFFRATDTDSLRHVYREIDQLEKTIHAIKKFSVSRELFAWAILPALLLLGSEVALSHTRYRRLP